MLGTLRNGRAMPPIAALAIIVSALLMRVLVPQGWMPAQTDEGWRITICTGHGPVSAPIAMYPGMHMPAKAAQHHPGGHDDGGSDHACAFSTLALALDEPRAQVIAAPAFMDVAWRAGAAAAVAVGRGLAAPPPPSTGPPSSF